MTDLLEQWADNAFIVACSAAAKADPPPTLPAPDCSFGEKLRIIGAGVFSLPITCSFDEISEVMENTYELVTLHSEDEHQFAEALLFSAVQKKEYGENVMSMGMEMLSYVKELVSVYAEALTYESTAAGGGAASGTPQKDGTSPRTRGSISVPNTPGTRQSFNLRSRPGSISYRRGSGTEGSGGGEGTGGVCMQCMSKDIILAERLRSLNDKYIAELSDRETIARLNQQVQTLQERNQTLEHANDQLTSTSDTLGKQLSAAEAHILQLDHQTIALEKSMHAQKESFKQEQTDTFSAEREELTTRLAALQNELEDAHAEARRLHSMETELQSSKYDLSRCEKELASARTGLEEAVANMSHAEDEAADANRKLTALREQYLADKTKATSTEAEYKALVESHDIAYLKLMNDNKQMRDEIESLKIERSKVAGVSVKQARKKSLLELHLDDDLTGEGQEEDEDSEEGETSNGRSNRSSKKKSVHRDSMKMISQNVFAMELEIDSLQTENKQLRNEIATLQAAVVDTTKTLPVDAPPAPAPAPAPPRERSASVEVSRARLEELEREEATSTAIIEALKRDLAHTEALLLRLYQSEHGGLVYEE